MESENSYLHKNQNFTSAVKLLHPLVLQHQGSCAATSIEAGRGNHDHDDAVDHSRTPKELAYKYNPSCLGCEHHAHSSSLNAANKQHGPQITPMHHRRIAREQQDRPTIKRHGTAGLSHAVITASHAAQRHLGGLLDVAHHAPPLLQLNVVVADHSLDLAGRAHLSQQCKVKGTTVRLARTCTWSSELHSKRLLVAKQIGWLPSLIDVGVDVDATLDGTRALA